jgi:hypothetical protein
MIIVPLFMVEVFVIALGLVLGLVITLGRLSDISFSRN